MSYIVILMSFTAILPSIGYGRIYRWGCTEVCTWSTAVQKVKFILLLNVRGIQSLPDQSLTDLSFGIQDSTTALVQNTKGRTISRPVKF
jgi:hypothetical protein